MTYKNTNLVYRIAFDTIQNVFIAIDANNENNCAYGVTIEQAVANLVANK